MHNLIQRNRLFPKIQKIINAGYGRIIGIPASGKSTLLQQFCNLNSIRSIWINAADEESISSLFYLDNHITDSYLVSEQLLKMGTDLNFNETVLIIDNYDVVNKDKGINNILKELVLKQEQVASVITVSRANVSIFNDWMENSYPAVFDEDLRFEYAEIQELVISGFDIEPSDDLIKSLFNISGGWVFPLQTLCRSLKSADISDRNLILDKVMIDYRIPRMDLYFKKEILDILSPQLASDIMLLGSLSSFSSELALQVLNRDPAAVIETIRRDNIFLSYSSLNDEYSFHPVFTAYLGFVIKNEDVDYYREGLIRAAVFYEEKGLPEKSIRCLISAGKYSEAADLFTKLVDSESLKSEYKKMSELLSLFPQTAIECNNDLIYYKVIVDNLINPVYSRDQNYKLILLFKEAKAVQKTAVLYSELLLNHIVYSNSLTSAELVIEESVAFIEQLVKNENELLEVEQLKDMIILARCWIQFDRRDALKDLFLAETGAINTNNNKVLLTARILISAAYLSMGENEKAHEFISKAKMLFGKNESIDQLKPLVNYILIQIYYEIGKFDEALGIIRHFFDEGGEASPFRYRMNEYLFFCYIYSGRSKDAESVLEDYRSDTLLRGSPYQQYFLTLGQMLVSYIGGYRERAAFYCERLQDESNNIYFRMDPFSLFNICEVLMYTGNYGEAMQILLSILDEYQHERFPYLLATTHAFLALCHWRTGNSESSDEQIVILEKISRENNIRNLEICSLKLLRELSGLLKCQWFNRLTTLDREKEESAPSPFQARFITLGKFSAIIGGNPLGEDVIESQKKVMNLLRLLILYRNKGIQKEKLLFLLWPDATFEKAGMNLKNLIHRLKQIVGDGLIDSNSSIVKLAASKCWFDIDNYLNCITDARRMIAEGKYQNALDMYDDAFSFYKGDYFEDAVYSDQFVEDRENLRQTYMNSLFTASKNAMSIGEFGKAKIWLGKMISKDPCCEVAYRLHFIIYAKSGFRYKAIELMEQLKRNLIQTFEMKPDENTLNLIHDISNSVEIHDIRWSEEIFF